MIENYEHYISRNIKKVYRHKLIIPCLYLLMLLIFWFVFSLSDILFPKEVSKYSQIESGYRGGNANIQTELTDLYFTGYTNTQLGQTTGYYYYTLWEDHCIFVLLSPKNSEEGLPYIEKAQLRGRILKQGKAYQQLTDSLARDLSWTSQGLKSKVSPYLISEPAFHIVLSTLLMILFFATGIYALAMIGIYSIYILFPALSPPCRQLGRFGKPSDFLALAENELATLPQLATEDMFITEHFFIAIAASGIAIVPIQEILWIYKYSTLHKIFWYHFNISYTLHITTTKFLHIQCPKNMKSDIDGIMDYLAEANHEILVGFNEENRLKVQEIQEPVLKFEKLIAFLRRRI